MMRGLMEPEALPSVSPGQHLGMTTCGARKKPLAKRVRTAAARCERVITKVQAADEA